MKDFYLTETIKHYWEIVDPYLNNEEERDLFGLCMNTIVKKRDEMGLPERPKGRPKTVLQFKDTNNEYPEKVKKAIIEIKKEVKQMQEAYRKYKEETKKQKEEKQKVKEEKQKAKEQNQSYDNMKSIHRTNNINKENK